MLKIGIVTSSNYNIYAAVIIHRLKLQGQLPVCILSNEKSKLAKLGGRIRKREYASLAHDIGVTLGLRRRGGSGAAAPLEAYAASQGFSGWNAPLREIAGREGMAYKQVRSFNTAAAIDFVTGNRLDILINAGTGIFRRRIIEAPALGILNAHMGYLPTFRGMNVIEWSLFYGHTIGSTVHFIDRGIDTGDILRFRELPVEKGDTIETLRGRMQVLGVELLAECITHLEEGKTERIPQAPHEGKQYFVMHTRLTSIVSRGLAR
jgi:methionyl-tRNA formyltransferase